MDGLLNLLKQLLNTYGFQATALIIVTIAIVNILKKQIIKKAIEFAERTGYDKSIITKNISYLPYIVMFILLFIVKTVTANFQFDLINWNEFVAEGLLYGSVAIATYEVGKKQLQAYASRTKDVPKKQPLVEVKPDEQLP